MTFNTGFMSKNTNMAKRKNVERYAKNVVKKTHIATIMCAILFLVLGVLGGWFGYKTISKNDTFELVGKKEITLSVGETYTELGAKIVAFGKDVSGDVEITGVVDVNTEGTYFVTYTINNFKFKDVKKVRTVKVVA